MNIKQLIYSILLTFVIIFAIKQSEQPNRALITLKEEPKKYSKESSAFSSDEIALNGTTNYVMATFGSEYKKPLAIQISSNVSFVATCKNFPYFNCSEAGCQNNTKFFEGSEKASVDYSQFSVEGTAKKADVKLEASGDWSNTDFDFIEASTCSHNPYMNYDETKPYGAIGFGISDNFKNSFRKNVTAFSIFLQVEEQEGYFIFGYDGFKSGFSDPLLLSEVSSNWEVPYTSIDYKGKKVNHTGNVIFDINQDYIVVPKEIYDSIIDTLASYSITCTRATETSEQAAAICYHNFESIPSIPTLYINTGDGKQIEISEDIYIQRNSRLNGKLTYMLLIVPSGSQLNASQVQVTDSFSDDIILGVCFMNYYYTVFDFGRDNQNIQIFEAYKGLFNSPTNAGIGIGIVILVISILCCTCCYYSKRKLERKQDEQERAFLDHQMQTSRMPEQVYDDELDI